MREIDRGEMKNKKGMIGIKRTYRYFFNLFSRRAAIIYLLAHNSRRLNNDGGGGGGGCNGGGGSGRLRNMFKSI